ncbi:hypothetical protein SIN8267_02606 [Sinobacterium norvegicum]|uniref:DUF924 domain-containing protein n=1 Tax=Sinobacterium norvegicum TaxID=1641715 RepID=A0ABM9AH04_9GAMM|nr:DUF924 family protein [Sinobacterium norvegicum]CAH0992480.1 hypothetical protein SIN8267_02606 [Sinobacterium norvegicum]
MHYQQVLQFWFEQLTPKQWWLKDEDMDSLICNRFGDLHSQAHQCELFDWRQSAKGRLAEVIVLDQFSRNMFRDTPQSFASDNLALVLAQEAIAIGADKKLSPVERTFLYMPFMHSESKAIHQIAEKLFKANGNEDNYRFELRHKEIIDQFGRYPHRNMILGRQSNEQELEFLSQPGSSF